jgi:hypothetical protein
VPAHRGYSNWDLQRLAGKYSPIQDRSSGKRGALARCRARVAAVERVLSGCEAEAGLLAAELTARRDYWLHHLSPSCSPQKGAAFASRSANRMVLHALRLMFLFVGFIVAMALGPLLLGYSASLPTLMFLLMPAVAIPFFVRMKPMFRLLRSLIHSVCPDCEYPLAELPDAIELPDGVRTGPAVCPECGCPWPLVPPRATCN